MRTLLLFLSLTVALGMPTFPSDGEQKPVAAEQNRPPVTGDWVPVQGHVVVEHPAPQVLLSPKEQQQQTAAAEQNQKEDEAELEDEEKPEVKDLKADPEAVMEEELKAEQEPAPEAPVEEEAEVEPGAGPDLMEEPDFKVESEVKVEAEGQPQDELEEEEDLLDPDFKVQSEVRVDADVEIEADPEEAHVLHEAPEKFPARVDVDREIDPGMEVEERHIDMEGKLQPSMESELLDDDVLAEEVSHTEPSAEEMAFGDASQQQDAASERLPEEEEEEEEEDKVDGEEDFREKKENGASDEQEIMELEPELTAEQNPEDLPDAAVLDEEPLDPAQQQQTMPQSENYVPEEETGMETYLRDEGAPEQFSEEPGMQEEGLPMMMEDDTYRQGGHYCPGMITGGKCYQFFRGPKKYEEAELFCQEQFSGGHLASIKSQRVHQELVRLIQQRGGYTRTWVGGRRLDSHLFIWLDGSRWSYDDWLPGEPNNTANVENCLEVLGNGKFNDFTCWEPQAFVCSYPSQ